MKLHLVDATFELFRAFYSRPPRRAPDGRPVNAVQGLVDSMLSLLRESDVTHIGAATDHVIESWRNDRFPGYKDGSGGDPDLLAQFDDVERAVRALGVVVWSMDRHEADDALATAAVRWGDEVEQRPQCSEPPPPWRSGRGRHRARLPHHPAAHQTRCGAYGRC